MSLLTYIQMSTFNYRTQCNRIRVLKYCVVLCVNVMCDECVGQINCPAD